MTLRRQTLQDELKQLRPYESSSEEVVVAVLRTASLIRRAVARRVEPHGLSAAQYNVLRILRGAGAKGLPTLAVRDRLIEEAPGITRLMGKLETAGLVVRDRSGRDRRTIHCRLTARGSEVLAELDRTIRETHELAELGLGKENDRKGLIMLLEMLRSGLHSDEASNSVGN